MGRSRSWLVPLAIVGHLLVAAPGHAGVSVSVKDQAKVFVEGDSGTKSVEFKVVLSTIPETKVKVDYKAVEGMAKKGEDFLATNGTLVFLPGDRAQTVKVPAVGDLRDEAFQETFKVKLSNPVRASIVDDTATGWITDNDPAPNLVVEDGSVNEGAGTYDLEVRLDQASGKKITVAYWSTPEASNDFEPAEGDLVFKPDDVSETITIPITEDNIDEDPEPFSVEVGGPQVGSDPMGPHTWFASITINDNDAMPTISFPASVSRLEGNGGFVYLDIPLTWSRPTERTVEYSVSLEHVTTDSEDFWSLPVSPQGAYSTVVTVGLDEDTYPEANESFTLSLTGTPKNVGYDATASSTTVTLQNDD